MLKPCLTSKPVTGSELQVFHMYNLVLSNSVEFYSKVKECLMEYSVWV